MGLYPQVILKYKIGHCARGSKMCEKCKELEKNPKYLFGMYMSGICNTPEVAHHTYFINYKVESSDGASSAKLEVCSNAQTRAFKTEKEAKEYAGKNKLQIFTV